MQSMSMGALNCEKNFSAITLIAHGPTVPCSVLLNLEREDMKLGINLSINVSNIDKSKMIQGKKGNYLNMTVFVDPDNADQYGNHGMITQSLPKEEREAGQKGNILGNAKVFWSGSSDNRTQNTAQASAPATSVDDSEIPFIDPYKFIRLVV